jgi:hypothetical protein
MVSTLDHGSSELLNRGSSSSNSQPFDFSVITRTRQVRNCWIRIQVFVIAVPKNFQFAFSVTMTTTKTSPTHLYPGE